MKIIKEKDIGKAGIDRKAFIEDNREFRKHDVKPKEKPKGITPEERQAKATEELVAILTKAINKPAPIIEPVPLPPAVIKETQPIVINQDRPRGYKFTILRDNYGLIKNVIVEAVE